MIDLNNDTMELKKIEITTSLRVLSSGHVAHKLNEFAHGGWKAPTLEQTKLFPARSGDLRPVILPGGSRQRRRTRQQISQVVHNLQSHSPVCAATNLFVIVGLMTKRPLTSLPVMY